ncbi:hypothetical protein H0H92_003579, partial [Tricholoma furcatifolium]
YSILWPDVVAQAASPVPDPSAVTPPAASASVAVAPSVPAPPALVAAVPASSVPAPPAASVAAVPAPSVPAPPAASVVAVPAPSAPAPTAASVTAVPAQTTPAAPVPPDSDSDSESDNEGAIFVDHDPRTRWYCVTRGTAIGVIPHWDNVGPHVQGVSNASFARYPSRALAEQAFARAVLAGNVMLL